MVVVLVDAMNADTPSAAAGVVVVADTLAFIIQIVADGIVKAALAESPSRSTSVRYSDLKSIKSACQGGFYKGFKAVAQ
jgi:hypothetical protein